MGNDNFRQTEENAKT